MPEAEKNQQSGRILALLLSMWELVVGLFYSRTAAEENEKTMDVVSAQFESRAANERAKSGKWLQANGYEEMSNVIDFKAQADVKLTTAAVKSIPDGLQFTTPEVRKFVQQKLEELAQGDEDTMIKDSLYVNLPKDEKEYRAIFAMFQGVVSGTSLGVKYLTAEEISEGIQSLGPQFADASKRCLDTGITGQYLSDCEVEDEEIKSELGLTGIKAKALQSHFKMLREKKKNQIQYTFFANEMAFSMTQPTETKKVSKGGWLGGEEEIEVKKVAPSKEEVRQHVEKIMAFQCMRRVSSEIQAECVGQGKLTSRLPALMEDRGSALTSTTSEFSELLAGPCGADENADASFTDMAGKGANQEDN